MKKFLLFLAAAVMVFSMAGCKKADRENGQPDESTQKSNNTQEDNAAVDPVDNKDEEEQKKTPETKNTEISTEFDEAIAQAIIDHSNELYEDGECDAEGHIVLDFESDKASVTVYLLTSYGKYGLSDGEFVKMSGTTAVPAVLSFDNSSGYILKSYDEPAVTGEYASNVKEMFPEDLQDRLIFISDQDRQELDNQEQEYVRAYVEDM